MRVGGVLNSPLAAPPSPAGSRRLGEYRRKLGDECVDPFPEPDTAALAAPCHPGQEGGARGRPEDLHGEPEAHLVGLAAGACARHRPGRGRRPGGSRGCAPGARGHSPTVHGWSGSGGLSRGTWRREWCAAPRGEHRGVDRSAPWLPRVPAGRPQVAVRGERDVPPGPAVPEAGGSGEGALGHLHGVARVVQHGRVVAALGEQAERGLGQRLAGAQLLPLTQGKFAQIITRPTRYQSEPVGP